MAGNDRERAFFHPEFREDFCYLVEIGTSRRRGIRFDGLGKPEPLKYLAAGTWSRRLTQEHRIVYLVSGQRVDFLQARYHY